MSHTLTTVTDWHSPATPPMRHGLYEVLRWDGLTVDLVEYAGVFSPYVKYWRGVHREY